MLYSQLRFAVILLDSMTRVDLLIDDVKRFCGAVKIHLVHDNRPDLNGIEIPDVGIGDLISLLTMKRDALRNELSNMDVVPDRKAQGVRFDESKPLHNWPHERPVPDLLALRGALTKSGLKLMEANRAHDVALSAVKAAEKSQCGPAL